MTTDAPTTGRQIRSLVSPEGTLEVSLREEPTPEPSDSQVVIRVEASPINPSDLGLLFAGADVSAATVTGPADNPVVTVALDPNVMRGLAGRLGQSMPVGNEGAGTVVAAGSSDAARSLLGRTVSVAGGAMYAQYRCVDASLCLVLPEGTPARRGASAFVNPLTALGMVETMRREGRGALVHTAAASNLGQMLVRLCQEERVPLVNIVRRPDQVETLTALGATHVCDSSTPTFMRDLIDAVEATSATLAFDATGGGTLASQILTAMEVAATKSAAQFSRYGSTTHKQVYIYGGLDRGPTILNRSYGMAWSVGGWLLTPFLMTLEPAAFAALRERVAKGLATTFASAYTKEVSLAEALHADVFTAYSRQATGEKYLIAPHKA
ncbi:MAG: zinc-binding dehydrogenase [Acidimicrobiales bacterium]